jgi:hypothetical protein
MIIDDFHFIGIVFLPNETETELLINPDATLSFPIPFEDLQPVSRGTL